MIKLNSEEYADQFAITWQYILELIDNLRIRTKEEFVNALRLLITVEWLPYELDEREENMLEQEIMAAYERFEPELNEIHRAYKPLSEMNSLLSNWWYRLVTHVQEMEVVMAFSVEANRLREADNIEFEKTMESFKKKLDDLFKKED